MSELPVEVRDAGRRYGRRRALHSVDLEVRPGEIVGLVGPNGSGKTTLLKLLAGFLRPSDGELRVFGQPPFRAQAQVMERARFAFAPPALFDSLTAREHLRYLGRLSGARGRTVTEEERRTTLERVGLGERADDRVRTFSFGMRQRLCLAQALLPLPELLVLDEPTDGLDPVGIRDWRRLLLELRDRHGLAILLSSHLLSELERLADRILVLSEGEPTFFGSPAELVRRGRRLRLRVSSSALAQTALRESGVEGRIVSPNELELEAEAVDLETARGLLMARDVRLEGFAPFEPSLEDALWSGRDGGLPS